MTNIIAFDRTLTLYVVFQSRGYWSRIPGHFRLSPPSWRAWHTWPRSHAGTNPMRDEMNFAFSVNFRSTIEIKIWEIFAAIHQPKIIHEIQFREMTLQRSPQNRKRKRLLYIFMKQEETILKMVASFPSSDPGAIGWDGIKRSRANECITAQFLMLKPKTSQNHHRVYDLWWPRMRRKYCV